MDVSMLPSPEAIQAAADRHDKARPRAHAAQASDRCGVLLVISYDSDQVVPCDVVECAHCSHIWQWIPGSGRRRGRCGKCGGLLCGRDYCNGLACTHAEQRLENLEAGRAFDHRPISVTTSGLILPGG